jgi:hypothetical protein
MYLSLPRRILLVVAVLATMVALSAFTRTSVTHASATAPTSVQCRTIYASDLLWHGPFPIRVHVNVPVCYDYHRVWKGNWGPDCSENTVGIQTTESWCGVSNNGGTYAEPGDNFKAFVVPWGPQYNCYYRVHVYNNGTYSTYGSC